MTVGFGYWVFALLLAISATSLIVIELRYPLLRLDRQSLRAAAASAVSKAQETAGESFWFSILFGTALIFIPLFILFSFTVAAAVLYVAFRDFLSRKLRLFR